MSAMGVRLAAVVAFVLVVQLALAPHLRVWAVEPDLLLLTALSLAVLGGRDHGVVAGFVLGLVSDISSGSTLGVSSFAYVAVAYVVASLASDSTDYSWVVATYVAVGSLAAELLFVVLSSLVARVDVSIGRAVVIAVVVATFNALAALFMTPALRPAYRKAELVS